MQISLPIQAGVSLIYQQDESQELEHLIDFLCEYRDAHPHLWKLFPEIGIEDEQFSGKVTLSELFIGFHYSVNFKFAVRIYFHDFHRPIMEEYERKLKDFRSMSTSHILEFIEMINKKYFPTTSKPH